MKGEIYAHVYENERVGLRRNLFWNLSAQLASAGRRNGVPVESVSCDWLTFSIRSWKDLSGLSLADCVLPELIECSVYQGHEHRWAQLESLSFNPGDRFDCFTLRLGVAALPPKRGTRPPPLLEIEFQAIFDGLYVIPANLSPEPKTPEAVIRAVQPFADPAMFEEPAWDRFRYVFKPRA